MSPEEKALKDAWDANFDTRARLLAQHVPVDIDPAQTPEAIKARDHARWRAKRDEAAELIRGLRAAGQHKFAQQLDDALIAAEVKFLGPVDARKLRRPERAPAGRLRPESQQVRLGTAKHPDRLFAWPETPKAASVATAKVKVARPPKVPRAEMPGVLRFFINASLFPITLVVALLAILWLAGRGIWRAAS